MLVLHRRYILAMSLHLTLDIKEEFLCENTTTSREIALPFRDDFYVLGADCGSDILQSV